MISATRYHDFCSGHRVHGHESKCSHLHGHNYRVHFYVRSELGLDKVGRVIDFSVINVMLCQWLEKQWDHKMLIWTQDPWLPALKALDSSVCEVPFNPTAELMAEHLLRVVGPKQLLDLGVLLWKVVVEETRKCSALSVLSP